MSTPPVIPRLGDEVAIGSSYWDRAANRARIVTRVAHYFEVAHDGSCIDHIDVYTEWSSITNN